MRAALAVVHGGRRHELFLSVAQIEADGVAVAAMGSLGGSGSPDIATRGVSDDDADDHGDADRDVADESEVRAHVDLDQRAADAADALHDLPHSRAATRSVGCPKVTVSGRALLAVTIDHRWLQAQLGHGLLDSDRAIDPATARRLACDAGVVPMVLGSRSEPLDVGRLSYITPMCVFHHHLIHHSGWEITMIDGRPWYRPPAVVNPRRRSRPGGRFPVPDAS